MERRPGSKQRERVFNFDGRTAHIEGVGMARSIDASVEGKADLVAGYMREAFCHRIESAGHSGGIGYRLHWPEIGRAHV